jgi:hypothetical protein
MSIKVTNTPGFTVVREIFPSGERAYRLGNDGLWEHSPDHKDLWFIIASDKVPQRIRDAVRSAQIED